MKNKKPYFETKIIYKHSPHKKQLKIALIIILVIVLISTITSTLVLIFNNDKINTKKYFCLVLDTTDCDLETINTLSKTYKARGASGLILDNNYIVLATYLNYQDANSVLDKLNIKNLKILDYTTPKIYITHFTQDQLKITRNIYTQYLACIDTLYDLSIQNDTDKSSLDIKQSIQALVYRYQIYLNSLSTISEVISTNTHPLYPIYYLTLNIVTLLDELATESNYDSTLITMSSVIRTIQYKMITINPYNYRQLL